MVGLSRFDDIGILYLIINIGFVPLGILTVKRVAARMIEPIEFSETYLSLSEDDLFAYQRALFAKHPEAENPYDVLDMYHDEWIRKFEYEEGLRKDVKLGWIEFTILREDKTANVFLRHEP